MKKLFGRIRNSPQEMSQDWNNMQNMRPPGTVLTDPLTGEDKVALQSKVSLSYMHQSIPKAIIMCS